MIGINVILQVIHKSLSLGQVLEGDRIAESNFRINFGIDERFRTLCGKYMISESDFNMLERAIEEQFYIELIVGWFFVHLFSYFQKMMAVSFIAFDGCIFLE